MAYGDIVTAGTVSGTAGSTTITGSSTPWASGPKPLQAADLMCVGGYIYPMTAVGGDGTMTIGVPLVENIPAGTSYVAILAAPARQAPSQISSTLPDLVSLLGFLVDAGLAVKCAGVNTNTPPGTPATGDYYAIGASPTGAWAGNAGSVAKWTGSAWYIRAATIGDMAIDTATPDLFVRTASTWEARSLTSGAVRYDTAQSLSLAQLSQARANIGSQFFSGLGHNISGLDLHNLTGAVRTDAGFLWGNGVTNAPSSDHWAYLKMSTNGSSSYMFLLAFSWHDIDGSGKPIIKYKRLSGSTYSPWYSVSLT